MWLCVRAFVGSMCVRVVKKPSTLLYVRQMPVRAYAGLCVIVCVWIRIEFFDVAGVFVVWCTWCNDVQHHSLSTICQWEGKEKNLDKYDHILPCCEETCGCFRTFQFR